MQAELEVLVQPYSLLEGRCLLVRLVEEFRAGNWEYFRAAVAFAKASGNYEELLLEMLQFAQRGGRIDATFGADTFGGEAAGSEYQAIKTIVDALAKEPSVRIFLYHENGRTFHPKVYMFSTSVEERALLIIGSSNWSTGGFWENIEVNVLIHLELNREDHGRCYQHLLSCFENYWSDGGEA